MGSEVEHKKAVNSVNSLVFGTVDEDQNMYFLLYHKLVSRQMRMAYLGLQLTSVCLELKAI